MTTSAEDTAAPDGAADAADDDAAVVDTGTGGSTGPTGTAAATETADAQGPPLIQRLRMVEEAMGGTFRAIGDRARDATSAVSAVSVPARDLGIPAGLLALFGVYLASNRWLDRGGLPMSRGSEQRGDDVQLVL